jgi:hypothetical protein
MVENKITWLQNYTNDRKDSVWYGGDVVRVKYGDYLIIVSAVGEIRAKINGEYYCDKNNYGLFKDYLVENGITNDKELKNAIENGMVEFYGNNWLEIIVWDDTNKDYVEMCDTIIDELDENDSFDWLEEWLRENIVD